MTPDRWLAIRADGNDKIGWGHAFRMSALAQAWLTSGGKVVWCTHGIPDAILRTMGHQVEWREARAIHDVARHADWIVCDGYDIGDDDQASLALQGSPLAIMDDYGHATHKFADLIVRQAHPATADLLHAAPYADLLAGPKFALIRREIVEHRQSPSPPMHGQVRCAITCGGADTANATGMIVDALRLLPDEDKPLLDVMVGAHYPNRESLLRKLASWPVAWQLHEQTRHLPELLRRATLVVTTGGCTMLESLCLGCPTAVLASAENQLPGCRYLSEQGAIIFLGFLREGAEADIANTIAFLLKSKKTLNGLSAMGARIVDGRGAERIVRRLQIGRVRLRPVSLHDCAPLFQLRNDPLVVASSRVAKTVSWTEHCRWFHRSFRDSRCRCWIVHSPKFPFLGQVRLDRSDTARETTISISLTKEARGLGLGAHVIRQATAHGMREPQMARIIAWIKPENVASQTAFLGAGFRFVHEICDGCLKFVWERNQSDFLAWQRAA